ncbi:MAG: MoaD/ThiS family protein [Phycisphaeraceae bacterium]|nr:MoaD/ThiS family protein [Phycisphaeraceae bacterium]
MMRIRVLLFGPEAAAAGCDGVDVEVEDATCAGVLIALAEQHPALRSAAASARLAVNRELSPAQREIRAGDELALIGLVSGG